MSRGYEFTEPDGKPTTERTYDWTGKRNRVTKRPPLFSLTELAAHLAVPRAELRRAVKADANAPKHRLYHSYMHGELTGGEWFYTRDEFVRWWRSR